MDLYTQALKILAASKQPAPETARQAARVDPGVAPGSVVVKASLASGSQSFLPPPPPSSPASVYRKQKLLHHQQQRARKSQASIGQGAKKAAAARPSTPGFAKTPQPSDRPLEQRNSWALTDRNSQAGFDSHVEQSATRGSCEIEEDAVGVSGYSVSRHAFPEGPAFAQRALTSEDGSPRLDHTESCRAQPTKGDAPDVCSRQHETQGAAQRDSSLSVRPQGSSPTQLDSDSPTPAERHPVGREGTEQGRERAGPKHETRESQGGGHGAFGPQGDVGPQDHMTRRPDQQESASRCEPCTTEAQATVQMQDQPQESEDAPQSGQEMPLKRDEEGLRAKKEDELFDGFLGFRGQELRPERPEQSPLSEPHGPELKQELQPEQLHRQEQQQEEQTHQEQNDQSLTFRQLLPKPESDPQKQGRAGNRIKLWSFIDGFYDSLEEEDILALRRIATPAERPPNLVHSGVPSHSSQGTLPEGTPASVALSLQDTSNGLADDAQKQDEVSEELERCWGELSKLQQMNKGRIESVLEHVLPKLQGEKRRAMARRESLAVVGNVLAQQREARKQGRRDRREREAQAVLAAATAAVAASPRVSHTRRVGHGQDSLRGQEGEGDGQEADVPGGLAPSSAIVQAKTAGITSSSVVAPFLQTVVKQPHKLPVGSGTLLHVLGSPERDTRETSSPGEKSQGKVVGTGKGTTKMKRRRRGMGAVKKSKKRFNHEQEGHIEGDEKGEMAAGGSHMIAKARGLKQRCPRPGEVKAGAGLSAGMKRRRAEMERTKRALEACSQCGGIVVGDRIPLGTGPGIKLESKDGGVVCTCRPPSHVVQSQCSLCLQHGGELRPESLGPPLKPPGVAATMLLHPKCGAALQGFLGSSEKLKEEWPVPAQTMVSSLAASLQEILQPPVLLELTVKPVVAELINACLPPSYQYVPVAQIGIKTASDKEPH